MSDEKFENNFEFDDDDSELKTGLTTSKIIILAIAFLLIFIISVTIFNYNKLVVREEGVSEAYSDIESNMQRKLDVLPNLVKVVKAYAQHEKELLSQITTLRSSRLPKSVDEMEALNKNLNLAAMRFFAIAENYPNLKSSEQFIQLQAQIEGAENRINVTRMLYNETVKKFNAQRRIFPSNIIADFTGFTAKDYFKAETNAHKKINLDL